MGIDGGWLLTLPWRMEHVRLTCHLARSFRTRSSPSTVPFAPSRPSAVQLSRPRSSNPTPSGPSLTMPHIPASSLTLLSRASISSCSSFLRRTQSVVSPLFSHALANLTLLFSVGPPSTHPAPSIASRPSNGLDSPPGVHPVLSAI